MKAVQLFLEEVTEELLYNIVYDNKTITHFKLRDEFEMKTGHKPMNFFGFGNKTGCEWSEFINEIPGLEVRSRNVRTMYDDSDFSDDSSDEDDTKCVYEIFNTTYLKDYGMTVAEYREQLLIKCCEIMKDDFADFSGWKNANDNTPLHLLAALPGITYNCDSLVKYLMKAGVDPLATNNNGQTFLHILFGRYLANVGSSGEVNFMNERATITKWFFEDRNALLRLVSKQLSKEQLALLAKAQDNDGDTVLHECALSTTVQQEIIQELITFGANLRIPNNTGEVPLHFAFHPSVFNIFAQTQDAVCRARNDRDETPVLFILKMAVELAFTETIAFVELSHQGFVKTTGCRNVNKAINLLENLTSIVAGNPEVIKTAWIPDLEGNVAVDIVLIAIRIGSYDLKKMSACMVELGSSLLRLLSKMLREAGPSDMKRQNKKGQNVLHVLLDVSEGSKHKIIKGTYVIQSIEILLKYNADVNAVDYKGRTPLDIAHKNHDKGPALYQKCAELLVKNGAVSKWDLLNGSSLVQGMSNLGISNETRKLRSCPKRHLKKAERLTDSYTRASIVGKYRYFNEDPVGSGAFSTIFVAIKDENVDSRSGTIECRAYALKRLDKAKINPQEIKREITTLLSISGKCENIIKYHDSDEDHFFQYLCLDLMDGDLQEFVEYDDVNKVLRDDPALPVQVTKQIVNGLAFLHEYDFIHRDLKPGNILYTTDSTLHFKIADFGLAKNTSTFSTMTSTRGSGVAMVPGTRCWMAPELVSMESREHTQQSDIFCLGLVLHYLLTLGKHPFAKRRGERPHVIERKIEEMQMHLDMALHPEAISFLQVLLTKNPSRRPPATYLDQHPFLWSESKKIEFLKAVGDQREAEKPAEHHNSKLEQRLQKTPTGMKVGGISWDQAIEDLFEETTKAWRQKKYRTDKVIDLIRFIRNAYAHRQERSLEFQEDLENNIFLRKYPSLVLDAFGVVQKLGFDKERSNIRQALSL